MTKDEKAGFIFWSLVVLVLLAVFYAAGRVQKNDMEQSYRAGINGSLEGFRQYVQNVYPGCKVIKISAVGPGYYDNEKRVYRANGVIELADGSRKPIELLCDEGVCWSRQMVSQK